MSVTVTFRGALPPQPYIERKVQTTILTGKLFTSDHGGQLLIIISLSAVYRFEKELHRPHEMPSVSLEESAGDAKPHATAAAAEERHREGPRYGGRKTCLRSCSRRNRVRQGRGPGG